MILFVLPLRNHRINFVTMITQNTTFKRRRTLVRNNCELETNKLNREYETKTQRERN